ncbi:MAG: polynucleotide adenylyltransferase PcnB, partial [Pseudomonadota bacterium]
YDFLLLRCASGEVDEQLGLWWDEFQDATEHRRAEMLVPDEAPKKRRRKKSGRATAAAPTELPVE